MRFLIGASPSAMAADFRPEIWSNIVRKSWSETTAGLQRSCRRNLLTGRSRYHAEFTAVDSAPEHMADPDTGA
jgi:hypothetical protein